MSKDWKEMERVVARKLGVWWGCQFRRTPSSGGWGKQVKNSASDSFHGDIVAPEGAGFPFSVECKAYETVELYQAMYALSNIYKWWNQCWDDAHRVGKAPMLVMRENHKQHYLMAMELKTFVLINRAHTELCLPRMTLVTGSSRLVIHDLDIFTKCFPKETILRGLS